MKKIVAILMAMMMVISVTVVLAGSAADKDTKTKEPVIIGFKSTPGAADKAMVRGHGGDIKYSYTIINAIAAKLPEPAIENIQKNPRVTYVEMDGEVHTLDAELDNSWGVKHIGAGTVHDSGNKGTGVTVAILDTGIDYSHPDLNDNYIDGYDFANDDSDPMDDNGHGTHCAGIVAAEDNGVGVVGVAPEAHLYAVKVLNSGGSGSVSDVIAGIQWSVNKSMAVISMSFGGGYSGSMEAACDAAYNAGIAVVAAAGNDGNPPGKGDNVGYPAGYSSVIAVAATDSNDNRARWSSTGPAVELAAPGVSVKSTDRGGGYATKSGTSMACPHVAGTAALAIVAGEGNVRQCLQDTADDLGPTGFDTKYGYGLVDADGAALPDITPPAKVTGLTVNTVSSSQLDLNWNANTENDLDYYNVYNSTTPGGPYDLIASTITNSYSDTGLAPSTTYYYKVSAVDSSDNEGEASEEASGTTSKAGGDVMHVSAISMWYTTGGPNYFIYTKVTIVDSKEAPVTEATVYLEMTLPDTTVYDSGSTNGEGTVTFKLKSRQTGTYTSMVTDVKKSGWTYDPEGETSKTLPVP